MAVICIFYNCHTGAFQLIELQQLKHFNFNYRYQINEVVASALNKNISIIKKIDMPIVNWVEPTQWFNLTYITCYNVRSFVDT